MDIYEVQLSLLSPRGLEEMIKSMGVMVVASIFPASRKVVKPIKCEYTRILDNMLLLRKFRYGYKCDIGASLCVYKTCIQTVLNSNIIANIEICFIRMQWVV